MARIPMTDDEHGGLIRHLEQAWQDRGLPQSIYSSFTRAAEDICESPIERTMLAELLFCSFGYYDDVNRILTTEHVLNGYRFDHDSAVIIPQFVHPRLNYRLDFLVVLNPRHAAVETAPSFAVECDGHDFHEKTKDQAARDKRRDRDIQALGIPVFRFTGSEIHKDIQACVRQLDGYGSSVLEKLWGLP